MTTKECPWCGESMQLKESEETSRIPGTRETSTRKIIEWVCPSCDHFEEADPHSDAD